MHTDQQGPDLLHGKLLFRLVEHCHDSILALTILIPVTEILDSLNVLLSDHFLLFLGSIRHLVALMDLLRDLLRLD